MPTELPSGPPVDPTSATVAQNLKTLRTLRGWSHTEVASRISHLTKPGFAPNMISKIELGVRRVTVDDLMALAIAFEVSPLVLLLPWPTEPPRRGTNPEASVYVSGAAMDVNPVNLWLWGRGQEYPGGLGLRASTYDAEVVTRVFNDLEHLAAFKSDPSPETLSRTIALETEEYLDDRTRDARALAETMHFKWGIGPGGFTDGVEGDHFDPDPTEPWSKEDRNEFARCLGELHRLQRELARPDNDVPEWVDSRRLYGLAAEVKQTIDFLAELEDEVIQFKAELRISEKTTPQRDGGTLHELDWCYESDDRQAHYVTYDWDAIPIR